MNVFLLTRRNEVTEGLYIKRFTFGHGKPFVFSKRLFLITRPGVAHPLVLVSRR